LFRPVVLPSPIDKAITDVDDNNWTGLAHAIDATTYSERAMEAALSILEGMRDSGEDAAILHYKTTVALHKPCGYTCLHFACDASDKIFGRVHLVEMLLKKKADIEARTAKGNTPFLLASGSGQTDVVNTLMAAKCDGTATNKGGNGALQRARDSSGDVFRALSQASIVVPNTTAESGRMRTGTSAARHTRYKLAAEDPGVSHTWSAGWGSVDEWSHDEWADCRNWSDADWMEW